MKQTIRVLVIILFFISVQGHASVYLKSLHSAARLKHQELIQPKRLLVIFKANCKACLKQIQDLGCLNKKYSITLLGISSSENELRRLVLKSGTPYPAYIADKVILNKLDIQGNTTPQVLFFSKNSTKKVLGYTPCEQLKNKF